MDRGSLLGARNSVLGNLDDENCLVDHVEESDFNCMNNCELCDVKFAKIKGINRHHCRKCNKSVCGPCSTNKRRLAKTDETEFRVCD